MVPVIALAIWDRLRRPGRSKRSPLPAPRPARACLSILAEQRAGLQTQALARLRRTAVERSADAILFPRAKDPSDRFIEIAECVGVEPVGQHSHQKPALEMSRRLAAQVGAPLTAQPLRSRPSRLVTIDRRKHRVAAKRPASPPLDASPPARSCRAPGSCRLRRLRRLALRPAAIHRVALRYGTISHVSREARDPVGSISSADPFADHGIPSFAQPGERRPRRVRQPSRSLSQIEDGRAVGAPQKFDHHRQLAAVSRGHPGRVAAFVRTGAILRLRLRASPGSIASCDPSSTAMAFKPAAVNLSA